MLAVYKSKSRQISLAVLMLCSATTQAADWLIAPSAKYRFLYNDNYLLNVTEPIKVNGHILDLDAKIKYESEKNVVDIVPKISIRRIKEKQNFTNTGSDPVDLVPDYDREDYFLKLNTAHSTKWMDVQFNANASKDSTELDPEQFNSFQTLATRNRWDASPTFIFQLTETTNVNVGVNYSDVRYEDTSSISSLNDYAYGSAFAGVTNEITERLNITVSFTGSQLRSDSNTGGIDIRSISKTYVLQGDVTYALSETEALRLNLGKRRTVFENRFLDSGVNIASSDLGYVFDFEYSKSFESNQWRATAGRFVTPSSSGLLSQRDKITLSVNHQLLTDLRVNVGVNATRIDDALNFSAVSGRVDLPFRVYSTANLGLSWGLARNWFLSVAYIYRNSNYRRTLKDGESIARSHTGQLILTYTPRKSRPYEIF